jgi:hypothetical protein
MLEDMHWFILFLAFMVTVGVSAEVYKWADSEGNIVYSDRPHPGAEELKNLEVQTYPAPKLPSSAPELKPKPFPGYDKVEITSPANDEAIRENTGNVSVSVNLMPDLQTGLGHKLMLLIDGKKVTEGTATQFQLTNLDRGSHSLQATVIDPSGKEVASSAPSTFHLQRVSTLNPASGAPAP